MAMTQKDYRKIAGVLHNQLHQHYADPNVEATAYQAIATIARDLARLCKEGNPRFRYDTFFETCGLDDWGEPFNVSPSESRAGYLKDAAPQDEADLQAELGQFGS